MTKVQDRVPMTIEGYEKLKSELDRLKKVERPKNVKDIEEAREHGDISENAEFHAAKEKQSFIAGRINEVTVKLSKAEVINTDGMSTDKVVFGAFVEIEDENNGDVNRYRIVGDDEADIKEKKISISSPLARGLIGKRLDDSVKVQTPGGVKEYIVLDISYKE